MNRIGTGVAITGCGSAAPKAVFTNHHLSQIVETSDEWISSRTGMKTRRLASTQESLSQMSAEAAQNAIAMAGLSATEIDLIILATSTPDDLFGSASKIQGLLGATRAVAFDLTAACSGFVFALITAAQYIRTGVYQNVVVIGADVLSRWVDWSDRTTCVLFGDGAGAVVCQGIDTGDRLLAFEMYSDGSQNNSLNLAYQGQAKSLVEELEVSSGTYQPITMNGREVYRFAVAKVPEAIEKAMFRAGITSDQIDWLLLHQANQRIMDAVAKRLKLPSEKVLSNIEKYGNTSAASIPLALDEAVRTGKVQAGDLIAASGFGAGLTWGAALFHWG
ncbi:3-oxoacyl-(acyl-carrier-protein) synthase 3 [Stanieria cyanosphaera PCC 7437]|uniref:Beta-ketoacyl-[acyl-carrier-protein] synthase III n=1 Tax=Stanieria cyanosphaera (strain ATCC 29371 / PCC 7437) TaxID=111780 RepID=K9XS23_STAC7|nr:beta-ketoacyl-ACP synthase III [Stanieria cyanosphaera]AFZ34884.1 3-oxoacyl-(acyl-carrier-protein) synthase 3 [Stanieria cyanosphaera PCC 7437]